MDYFYKPHRTTPHDTYDSPSPALPPVMEERKTGWVRIQFKKTKPIETPLPDATTRQVYRDETTVEEQLFGLVKLD
ncbi:hypothetical protein PHYBLDRAFT_146068 [Phycomyces blakesleeanus NRRL 1555(-)]|uniref:Uncharacterized protein n=1 Tax=Phycomyces blakesleeanus (strain ATCC 8743b / DSM 1359 / FGSC 10004 / NBRC 33097 / NRRL 1555) TaxID=763407 RepID=A0A162PH18_PHYB8|nr:hypothetical protein PHYBLDRAFT_146068 [Phycomyces blakesleeanus NRRL 1555(-)]OAD72747.1 hypothetical protein PHYBLDRAFT_146068 [Phycomyces blakesleeanus NRRL 1555(-)]|eukprot:XP_018290787.1 hypothetical protein PHYBLDRAFT_146068 [Phycomyces blakesleeanus NRRL 1555(-)]